MIEQHKYDGGITGWWCRYEYPNGKQCGEHRGNTAVHLPDAPEMLNRTIPFEGQALFPKADPPQYQDYPPEMLEARLYVFEGQNYVSEKDYRAVLEQRRGFENAALDNETAAKKAKEQLAACRREFFEYRKVAWENEEIGHKALDDLQQAREAGRREGHLDALQALVTGLGMDINVRALLDSPKAEGEEPSDDYVAWLQFRQRSFRVCDSDAEGAFRVYRHPKEAEGEEPK